MQVGEVWEFTVTDSREPGTPWKRKWHILETVDIAGSDYYHLGIYDYKTDQWETGVVYVNSDDDFVYLWDEGVYKVWPLTEMVPEHVVVPYGEFDAYYYDEGDWYNYFVPGVGYIKWIQFEHTYTVTGELVDIHIPTQVSFPDYFPLDAASHGLKTFQWTHGRTGSYQSYISGTLTVPYTSGAIEGTGIVNMSDLSQLYATNDGSEVKWIAYAIETEFGYISTDCSLADHPASWTFSTVTDDMLLDQGTYYFVDPSLTPCEMDNKQSLLFDIQDVSVPFGQYDDAVIIWWLDEQCSFTALDFSGKDIDLGITLPNGTQTGGHSVTAFDVYAYGIGMIACGDIAAETGELLDLAELVNIESSGQQVGDFCGPPGSEQADGYVDYWDLLYFAQRWHSSPSDTNWDPRCDLDKEKSYNYVDYWDLLFFAQQWHKGQKPK